MIFHREKIQVASTSVHVYFFTCLKWMSTLQHHFFFNLKISLNLLKIVTISLKQLKLYQIPCIDIKLNDNIVATPSH